MLWYIRTYVQGDAVQSGEEGLQTDGRAAASVGTDVETRLRQAEQRRGTHTHTHTHTNTRSPFHSIPYCACNVLQILAKELAGQLQVLENNAHPFYKPKLFVVSIDRALVN